MAAIVAPELSPRRILRILRGATAAEVIEGAAWYEAARTFAIGLSERYGCTLEQAIGVIAVLSPRLSWDRNMVYADTFLRTGTAPCLNGRRRAAAAVLAGDMSAVSGQKVVSFQACITDPYGSHAAVCIDRHAFDVAAGKVTDDRTRKILESVGGYQYVADLYRKAARGTGLTPSQVQAITWVRWRNLKAAGVVA